MPVHTDNRASLLVDGNVLRCAGSWTVGELSGLRRRLAAMQFPSDAGLTLDGSGITALDSAGAWLLLQVQRQAECAGAQLEWTALHASWQRMLEFVRVHATDEPPVQARKSPSWIDISAGIGSDVGDIVAFVGEVTLALLHAVLQPHRIRWQALFDDMLESGVKALPIVGLLSFLMGVVIAYQGAVQLKLYGANIYIADLVGYSMLRELSPLLTAILLCGRTGSAYAAKIGTMKVREEVDALQTIGVAPIDLLVLPKLLSLLLVLPLLTIYSDIMSIFGGMFMSSTQLGIGYHAFLARLGEAISYSTFMIGFGKAPVFAAIIAVVGCFQGFCVQGSAESVGQRTTISVVQSIFLVIIVDALFSILFSMMGI